MMEHPDEFNRLLHEWLKEVHLFKYKSYKRTFFYIYLWQMKINTAEFIISNSDVSKCPKEPLPEYAFIGRSNVGKSH